MPKKKLFSLFLVNILLFSLAFILYYPKIKSSQSSTVPTETFAQVVPLSTPTPITKKVLVLNFDPLFSNIPLHQSKNWNDPIALQNQYVLDVKNASHNYLNYQIVNTQVIRDYPVKKSGFKFTNTTYDSCISNPSQSFCDEGIDYNKLITDYNICGKVNNGEINEVWLWGGPYFGYWEAIMAGPNAIWTNATPILDSSCQKDLHIMGFNYELPVSFMLHDLGHRTESTIKYIYGGWERNLLTAWNRFSAYDRDLPGHGSCGNIHETPNITSIYDGGNYTTYSLKNYVNNYCEDWLNYPSTKGASTQLNCDNWLCINDWFADQYTYFKYWFNHLPYKTGQTNNKQNNWWFYVADYGEAIKSVDYGEKWYSVELSDKDYYKSCNQTLSNTNEIYFGTNSNCNNASHEAYFVFPQAELPKDSLIEEAYLEFVVDGRYTNPINLSISLSDGTTNSLPTAWNINTTWEYQAIVRSSNIKSSLQNLINSSTWAKGKTITAKIVNNGTVGERRVFAVDREVMAGARLVIKTKKSLATPTPTPTPIPTPTPVPTATPVATFTNLSESLEQNKATFNFNYPTNTNFVVEMAITSNFSSGIYRNFGTGNSSPVVVNDPRKWDHYTCGRQFWWRVIANGSVTSKIEPAVVVCPTPPNLISPANNQGLVLLNTVFDWSDGVDAQSYTFQLSKDPNFVSFVVNTNTTTSNYTVTTSLVKNTKYYWRVKSNHGTSSSNWSSVFNFTTVNPPNAAILTSPANGSTVIVLRPLFTWNQTTPASSKYLIQISKNTTFTEIVHQNNNVTTNSYTPNVDMPSGLTLYWRVRGTSSLNEEGVFSNYFSFKTNVGQVTLQTPTLDQNFQIQPPYPVFTWTTTPNAKSYTIQFAYDKGFTTTFKTATVTTNTYTSSMPLGKRIFWRVTATGVNGTISKPVISSFSTFKPVVWGE